MSINLFTDPLLHVCNKSLSCGIFPAELKIGKVVPIYKSGDIMRFINYRPVSILPVLSKVLERLVYNRLFKSIYKYQILYLYQFGFRQKHSNFMALASFIDKVTEFIDNGEYAIGVFLDFSRAFDTLIMISCLWSFIIMESEVWDYYGLKVICLIVYNMFHIIIIIPPCKEWHVVSLMGLYSVLYYFCC